MFRRFALFPAGNGNFLAAQHLFADSFQDARVVFVDRQIVVAVLYGHHIAIVGSVSGRDDGPVEHRRYSRIARALHLYAEVSRMRVVALHDFALQRRVEEFAVDRGGGGKDVEGIFLFLFVLLYILFHPLRLGQQGISAGREQTVGLLADGVEFDLAREYGREVLDVGIAPLHLGSQRVDPQDFVDHLDTLFGLQVAGQQIPHRGTYDDREYGYDDKGNE